MIRAEAIKCKHCGEFLESPHRVQTAPLPVLVEKSEMPAPKTTGGAKEINNTYVWLIVFISVLSAYLPFFILAASLGLCLADWEQLRKAGHNTKKMMRWWRILLYPVPAYLFARAKRLNQKFPYAYVWIVLVLLSVALRIIFSNGNHSQ